MKILLNLCLYTLLISLSACQTFPSYFTKNDHSKKPVNSIPATPNDAAIKLNGETKLDDVLPKQEKRVALIVGNANYTFAPLNNPINDAEDLSNALNILGFKVIKLHDASWEEMDNGLEQFKQELGPNTVGLFFFSGHGVQFDGNNYLLPTDLKELSARYVKHRSLTASYVLTAMESAHNTMNIIVLDACRDNPFKGGTRGLTKGLSRLQHVPNGTLIAYATSPGDVAADGRGRNSPYTKNILKFIHEPGLPIELMFKKVRNSVLTETSGEQTPWESSSIRDNFFFAGENKTRTSKEPVPTKLKAEIERLKEENKRLMNLAQLAVQKVDTLKGQLATAQKKSSKTTSAASDKKVFRNDLKSGSVGPEMVWIPAGKFKMGDIQNNGGSDELPVHIVSITKFAMGRYEVTFEEYDHFVKATGRSKPSDNDWGRGNQPVINVSWEDSMAYVKWLSAETGKQYRLPTEAEWEYSARAGTSSEYWWSDTWATKANCNREFNRATPVDSFEPNPFGLFDILGNVYEWIADPWHKNYKDAPSKGQNWTGNSEKRLLRGGAWSSSAAYCRVANRNKFVATEKGMSVGFRVALSQ